MSVRSWMALQDIAAERSTSQNHMTMAWAKAG